MALLSDALADRALAALKRFPCQSLGHYPTPIEPLDRFAVAAGVSQRLLVKRDDAISFAAGGNKVRKLRYVLPPLMAGGADTLITCGGVQSNHARATAAAAAASGLACHLVVNGAEPATPTGNALLNRCYGASFEYVTSREERSPGMARAAERFRAKGRHPAVIPLGASTPHGALGYVAAVGEMLEQGVRPDVIVHACSSGGTSAGLLAGCAVHRLDTTVIGISADDPPDQVESQVRAILGGLGDLLEIGGSLDASITVRIDDGFVGPGYGERTEASREAAELMARNEALLVDHTYTAKAVAGLLGYCRGGGIAPESTVLFWHTGGQIALFA